MIPSLIIFDLDRTLAASKEPVSPYTAELFGKLLARTSCAVISGGKFAQLKEQVVDQLPPDASIENLYLLPTSGAALYTYRDGHWQAVYEERLTEEQVQTIKQAMETTIQETGIITADTPSWGERIEARGSEVTLSALGQEAPIAEKDKWDPDGSKKRTLHDALVPMLPSFDVKTGGSTSIDVTLKGINKAYGIRKIGEFLSYIIADMAYVGDALYPGGNDEVVITTGIKTIPVRNPQDTEEVIRKFLAHE